MHAITRMFASALMLLASSAIYSADDTNQVNTTVSSTGIDHIYSKPEENKSWGEIVDEFVNHSGYQKSYALVVGVSNYTDPLLPDLPPTANDPIRFKDYLIDEAGYDHVHLLTEDKVTLSRVRELMDDTFPKLVGENDRFLFYWSGHGVTRPLESGSLGYLPLSSSKSESYSTMISMRNISEWNKLLYSARQTLYLLDSCFSGLAGVVAKSNSSRNKAEILGRKSSHIISAGTKDQQTIAHAELGGSIFTHALIEGFRGAADAANVNGLDGLVSLSELKGYVETKVDDLRREYDWLDDITPQMTDLRTSQGEYFFISTDSKKKKYEDEGHELTGDFKFGLPTKTGQPYPPVPNDTPPPDKSEYVAHELQVTDNNLVASLFASETDFDYSHLYLNIDSDSQTGYKARNGGDLMLFGRKLYTHDENSCDTDDDDWCWDYSKPVTVDWKANSNTDHAHIEQWTVPLTVFSDCPQTLEVVSEIVFSEGSRFKFNRIKNVVPLKVDFCKQSNSTPVARRDHVQTDSDTPIGGSLLSTEFGGADYDPDQDPIMVHSVQGSIENVGKSIVLESGSTIKIEKNGDFYFDPRDGFAFLTKGGSSSADRVTYSIEDTKGGISGEVLSMFSVKKIDFLSAIRNQNDSHEYIAPDLVTIPAGTFLQGATIDEYGSTEDERPVRTVDIQKFEMSKYELTWAEWEICEKANKCSVVNRPSYQKQIPISEFSAHPVTNISWLNSQEYISFINEKTGSNYRLPSESEWEYATRAETTSVFFFDRLESKNANYWAEKPYRDQPIDEWREKTVPVGRLPANAYGLHEVHGNVYEWVEDCWHSSYSDAPVDGSAWTTGNNLNCAQRVQRGGAWKFEGKSLRSANRDYGTSIESAYEWTGVRLAR